jgi:hypothetical protein
MPGKNKPMSFNDALKKYGGDVTKIPGWSGRGMDGKVKPKPKAKPKPKPKPKATMKPKPKATNK